MFSNFAHWFEGGLLGVIVITAILQVAGYLKFRTAQLIWSILILIAGSFLVPYMLLHHGLDRVDETWQFLMTDPQQLQHFLMGILLMVAGLSELLSVLNVLRSKLWQFIFPAALPVIGTLFMIHSRHGTAEAIHESLVFHRYLGTALILSGVAKAVVVIWGDRYKKIAYIWIFFMLITAGLLVTYREPNGAYNVNHSDAQGQESIPKGHHE